MLNFAKLLLLSSVGLGVASASTITLTALPTVQLSYDGNAGGTYNGFWVATVDGNTGVKVLCDDYTHSTSLNGTYSYVQSVLDGPNPLQNARWATSPFTPTQLTNYRAAAILVSQLIALGPSASAIQVTNYQYAIWDLFSPASVPTTTTQDTLKSTALTTAGGAITPELAAIYGSLVIYTPTQPQYVNGKSVNPQEFLGWDPTPVPEPSQAAGLLAVLGIGWFVRRRRMA